VTFVEQRSTHGFTGGNLQDLRGEPDRSLDAKVLVICPVDEIGRDCELGEHRSWFKEVNHGARTFLKVPDVSRGQGDPDFVNLGWWKGSPGGIVFLISLSDVTHGDIESEGD